MTIESDCPTFRGVVCLHCRAPIPIPNIVRMLLAAESGGLDSPSRTSQVFNLRCPACHKEKPYRALEIRDFEGTPEGTQLPPGPYSVRWFGQQGLTKAAKA